MLCFIGLWSQPFASDSQRLSPRLVLHLLKAVCFFHLILKYVLSVFAPPDLETICSIAVQILEQKAFCQQDPDQDEDEEAPEDQAEYDSVLVSSAGDLVSALASVLGPDFAPAFVTFFPLISKYYVSRSSASPASKRKHQLIVLYRKRVVPSVTARQLLDASLRSSQA